MLCLNCSHPLKALCCAMTTLLFLLLAIAGWVIYGWILYTSEDNDCADVKDTRIASIFLLIFCIFGICTICGACVLIFAVPITYCT